MSKALLVVGAIGGLLAVSLVSLHFLRGGQRKSDSESEVIFRDVAGQTVTIQDMQRLHGTYGYEIIGREHVPAEAYALHRKAREAGSAGDYKKALALLEQASHLAPKWPYPVYDTAYTYLLMKDSAAATTHYQKTVELAPRGFFTAITALDTLRREENGDLPKGTYLAYLSLEWVEDTEEKSEALQKIVEVAPRFAPAWKDLANSSDDNTQTLIAIEKGLASNPDAETKGMLQINKALVLDSQGKHDAALQLLRGLADDPKSTLETEHLAKITLALITKR